MVDESPQDDAAVDTETQAKLPNDPGVEAGTTDAADPSPERARHFTDDARAAIFQRYSESNRSADPSLQAARAGTQAMIEEGGDGVSVRAEQAVNGSPDSSSQQAAAPGGETPAGESAPLRTTTVKVYGRELEVPTETVEAAGGVAAFQKQLAADERLRQASNLARDLERRIQDMDRRGASVDPDTAAVALPSGESTAVSRKEVARKAMEALLESDADGFTDAFGKAIDSTVDERLRATGPREAHAPEEGYGRTGEDIRAANDVFASEFTALTQNPKLFQAAQDLMRARMASPEFASVPLDMLARDVGARVMNISGMGTSQSIPAESRSQTSNVKDRLDLRRAVKARLPASTTSAMQQASAVDAPKSYGERNSAYIRSLRSRSGSNSALAERRAR